MAVALATAGGWREDQPQWLDLEMPVAAPPEACRRWERVEGMPEFLSRFEVRWVDGLAEQDVARNVAWLRTDPPVPLSWALLSALADVWMPPAFTRLGRPAVVPTLDLTVHFRVPAAPDGEWVLADHRSEHSGGGTWTSDGELWAPDGTLLVQARQLALLRA
jgi:acyl-CoA thioesterase